MYEIPMCSIQLVKESSYVVETKRITGSEDVHNIISSMIGNKDREYLVVVVLNTKNDILGVNTVSIGSLNGALIHPREVFKAAILMNACSIILAHNHPSGDVTPSKEDNSITTRISKAGKLLKIPLLDHIIVTYSDDYFSYRDQNIL